MGNKIEGRNSAAMQTHSFILIIKWNFKTKQSPSKGAFLQFQAKTRLREEHHMAIPLVCGDRKQLPSQHVVEGEKKKDFHFYFFLLLSFPDRFKLLFPTSSHDAISVKRLR